MTIQAQNKRIDIDSGSETISKSVRWNNCSGGVDMIDSNTPTTSVLNTTENYKLNNYYKHLLEKYLKLNDQLFKY